MYLLKAKKPFMLMILDGWGIAPTWGGNAIACAKVPNFTRAWHFFPATTLLASGDAVGLPTNSPGNSEAGHLNMGAGQVVRQDITLIDNHIEDGSFFTLPSILAAVEHARKNNSNIHLLGLLSKTGIHSHVRHLYALLELFKQNNFSRVYIHLFSDGRDSDPMSGIETIDEVEQKIKEIGIGRIASISGRFYAMDRDNRWGRVSRAYNLLVKEEGECYESARAAFTTSYSRGITDEFIEPRLICSKTQEKKIINDNDSIIFFNFRSDRIREFVRAFLDQEIPQFSDRKKLQNIYVATFVIYDDHLLSQQIFKPASIETPLGRVWSENNLRQFHISETEKYPHITYFINGGVEQPFPGENRTVIPSPKNVKTYDYMPRMSSDALTDTVIKAIRSNKYEAFIMNFPNGDMVGHTGNLQATIQAVECVDECAGKILSEIIKKDGCVIIVGDHGNAEQMVNPLTSEPDTEHTTNPVPFIIVSSDPEAKKIKLQSNGILASVAPTILDIMGIKKPGSMRNETIIIKENC